MERKLGFLLANWMKSFFWMTATIRRKGIGSQQALAAHKGVNSPHLVQPKNDLSCRTGKICYTVIKKGICPHVPARREHVGQWWVLGRCPVPGRKVKSVLLLVVQEQRKTQPAFLPSRTTVIPTVLVLPLRPRCN